jgi:hypothetical protein
VEAVVGVCDPSAATRSLMISAAPNLGQSRYCRRFCMPALIWMIQGVVGARAQGVGLGAWGVGRGGKNGHLHLIVNSTELKLRGAGECPHGSFPSAMGGY